MESTKFYEKKLEGLKIIRGYLVAIDRVYGDLTVLENSQPAGDAHEEYAALDAMLGDVRAHIEDHISAVEAMINPSRNSITSAEIHASYIACLR